MLISKVPPGLLLAAGSLSLIQLTLPDLIDSKLTFFSWPLAGTAQGQAFAHVMGESSVARPVMYQADHMAFEVIMYRCVDLNSSFF